MTQARFETAIRKELNLPLKRSDVAKLRAGDLVALYGEIYTARDAAHMKMVAAIDAGDRVPFDLTDAAIYYTGPCPAPPGRVVGSIGPTTSSRMDAYAPTLIAHGQTVMLGKGKRCTAVIDAMRQYGAVYLGATGGAGAYLARHVLSSEQIAYPDLGAEAVYKLKLCAFPAIVLIDASGRNLYDRNDLC